MARRIGYVCLRGDYYNRYLIAEEYIFTEASVQPLIASDLVKHTWMVILHAKRVPPHIGMMIGGTYHSLTIKGHELDVSAEALLKTIHQRKINTLFLRLVSHPVFSTGYQSDIFREHIKQFSVVKQNETTCLDPVKLFLEEFYALAKQTDELMFELVKRMAENNYIHSVSALNMDLASNGFVLPFYSKEVLNSRIHQERAVFYND